MSTTKPTNHLIAPLLLGSGCVGVKSSGQPAGTVGRSSSITSYEKQANCAHALLKHILHIEHTRNVGYHF